MSGIIDKKTIFLNKSICNKDSLLENIANVSRNLNIVDSEIGVLNELNSREKEMSTYVGKNIAIPHCKSPIVKKSKLFVYRLDESIYWDNNQEDKVNLVFGILTNSRGKEHLSILAKLSRNLLKDDFLKDIKKSENADEVYHIVNKILQD